MTDYAEEQQNEIEALRSIYPEEFSELEEDSGYDYCITIRPEESIGDEPYTLNLNFKYTSTYPDELPDFDIEVVEGDLTSDALDKLKERLLGVCEDSIGMAMIFSVADDARTGLEEMIAEAKHAEQAVEDAKKRKAEEAEMAKFQGTKVTMEGFKAWKAKFDKEVEEKESREEAERLKSLKNKLTGRQLFEQDRSLATSDNNYHEEGAVSVDASQFDKEERAAIEDEQDDQDANEVWRQLKDET